VLSVGTIGSRRRTASWPQRSRTSQGAWQLAIGLILGAGGVALLLGVVAAAALKNILFKVNPLDPTIYFAVTGLLTLVAALSCFLPARRATRVDPMIALRCE